MKVQLITTGAERDAVPQVEEMEFEQASALIRSGGFHHAKIVDADGVVVDERYLVSDENEGQP